MEIRTLDDLSPLERLAVIPLSYSRLNTYETCPAKYFYTYIAKEPRVFGPAAVLGNVLHGVLEDVVGEPLNPDDMVQRMYVHREELDPDHQISQDLLEAGEVMLIEFADKHQTDTWRVIEKEMEFSVVIGSGAILGYIDLVTELPDGSIQVTDYKSGRWEETYKSIPKNLQLGIYALAVANRFPDRPIHAELYYLRTMRRKGHTFTPRELEQVYDRVLQQVHDIIESDHFRTTDDTKPCTYCDYAKSGVCGTGAYRMRNRRQWY